MIKKLFEFGVGLIMVWMIVGQIIQYQIPAESDLAMVYGRVQSADWVKPNRDGEYLKIQIIESQNRHTSIDTFVADNPNDFIKDELITIGIYNKEAWHIQVGNQVVQSFSETLQERKAAYRRQQYFMSLALALMLLMTANSIKSWFEDQS